jgi:hypothetical protein
MEIDVTHHKMHVVTCMVVKLKPWYEYSSQGNKESMGIEVTQHKMHFVTPGNIFVFVLE